MVAALGTQVYLILADVIFVTYYAQLGNPGLEQAAYSEFARQTAGAFVFCFAPASLYLIAAWLCRKAGTAPYLHAFLFIALYYALDIAIVALVAPGQLGETLRVPYLLNGAMMLLSTGFAAWQWQRSART
jgi:hypothetical protein